MMEAICVVQKGTREKKWGKTIIRDLMFEETNPRSGKANPRSVGRDLKFV